jgi:hypothetical protein
MKTADFERIRGWMQGTMPASHASFDDAAINGVIHEMQRNWRDEYAQLGVSKAATTSKAQAPKTLPAGPRYVMVEATHTRLSPIKSSFTGVVPMVQVTLPKTQQHILADTVLGEVMDGDIKLYCLDVFNEYYEERLGFEAKKVVVTTPPRIDGGRFAAVLYGLVYENESDVMPRCYYMAGGMANGPTRVLYSSKDMSEITSRGGYKPTPFSSVDHIYTGGLSVDSAGWADELWIDIKEDGKPVHLELRAKMKAVSTATPVSPYNLLIQAACRVAAIADEMGQEVPDLGPLTKVFAAIGRLGYSWNQIPTK